ncbi:unnamed protein product [Fasciola hepatica]|uniref:Secreted protein n=1 Tax=Fasciola hepatica TaxID=6192 RepID=A0ABC9HGR8_FASHE
MVKSSILFIFLPTDAIASKYIGHCFALQTESCYNLSARCENLPEPELLITVSVSSQINQSVFNTSLRRI